MVLVVELFGHDGVYLVSFPTVRQHVIGDLAVGLLGGIKPPIPDPATFLSSRFWHFVASI
jgi:hypothetical protein